MTKVNASAVADIIEKITQATFVVGLIFLFKTAKSVATKRSASPTKNRITFSVEPPLVTVRIMKMTKSRLVKNKIADDSNGANASKCERFSAKK